MADLRPSRSKLHYAQFPEKHNKRRPHPLEIILSKLLFYWVNIKCLGWFPTLLPMVTGYGD
jgi:hypothetical protein